MKKFVIYTGIVALLTLSVLFYTLYIVAKNQVINTFTYIEDTEDEQLLFKNVTFDKFEFSKEHYIVFVFKAECFIYNETGGMGWKDLSWPLCGSMSVDMRGYASYRPTYLYVRKIEAYKKHIAEKNKE